jgi:hypothetical protein
MNWSRRTPYVVVSAVVAVVLPLIAGCGSHAPTRASAPGIGAANPPAAEPEPPTSARFKIEGSQISPASSSSVARSTTSSSTRGTPPVARLLPTSPLGHPLMLGFDPGYYGSPETLAQQVAAIDPHSLVRVWINWAMMQPTCTTTTLTGCIAPGPVYWDNMDALLASLHARSLRVVGTIDNAPRWTWNLAECNWPNSETCGDDAATYPHPPADTPTVLNYVRQFEVDFLQRYESRYPGMFNGFEVWNEENAQTWWKTVGGPDPARYTRLLCTTYQAVKSVRPSIPVVFGGLGNILDTNQFRNNWYWSIGQFLDGAYSAGAARCMDALNLHPYTANQQPPDGPNAVFLYGLSLVRAAAARNGDAGRPIWITEFGYYTGCGTTWSGCQPATGQDQANFLECTYQLVASLPDVPVLVVLSMYDTPAPGGPPPPQAFGIFQDPTTPKPAVTMFTKLFHTFGDAIPAVTSCSGIFNWLR